MPGPFDFFDVEPATPKRWQGAKDTFRDVTKIPSPFKEGDRLGHFILERLLGSGSSGFVYRAFDQQTDRHVAMKVLRPGDNNSLLHNRYGFRRMMLIEHANLVKVDRIYLLDDYTCMTMEEVHGKTFAKRISEIAALPKQQPYETLIRLLRDFATGLAVMHAHGYVHRDIKPHNLMVDENGRGKIIDFGLVSHFEVDEFAFDAEGASWLGTPRYFAPEVIWSQKYLPSGDVYALGLVFAEAIHILAKATDWPVQSHSPGKSPELPARKDPARKHVDQKPAAVDPEEVLESLDGLFPEIPELLRTACRQMLQRFPSDRPTAMRMARVGLPAHVAIEWPKESPLVGRAVETDRIKAWVDSVFEGKVSRLHINGPSGIGKSRLVREAIRYIESKRWGQSFFGRCRAREDAPLQAFMQICDLIAYRYRRGDREKLQLDPVSTQVICQSFPVMATAIKEPHDFPIRNVNSPAKNSPSNLQPSRRDALDAAVAISEQLRLVGPLFIIIDDAQWADRDSLNVLDHLMTAHAEHGLGVITLSRSEKDQQQTPPEIHLSLGNLAVDQGVQVLQMSADRHGISIDPQTLAGLSQATDGSPFRLQELASEFEPSGTLGDPIAREEFLSLNDHPADGEEVLEPPAKIDWFWKRRARLMSDDAKKLLPLVAAGGRVSTKQLAGISGLGDSIDAAISELTRARLIIDDATGGECISIFHDRVADQLIDGLNQDDKRNAHLGWANWLIDNDDPSLAARIAGHLFAADRPRKAVHFAIAAAKDADRLVAKTEAARWYARAAEHTEGAEKVELIQLAAQRYQEADQPTCAARCLRELCSNEYAGLVDASTRDQYLQDAIAMEIRSGLFADARGKLAELAVQMQLPRPMPVMMTKFSLLISIARLVWQRRKETSAAESSAFCDLYGIGSQVVADDQLTESELKQRKQLTLCDKLARPMSLFDSLYASQLNLVAARLVKRYGTEVQRTHVAIGESIFGCYEPGSKRNHSEAMLKDLKQQVIQSGCLRSQADIWAGTACSHVLACRWDQVNEPVRRAMAIYRNLETTHSFEIAHTLWMGTWADWNLGRWANLVAETDSIIEDAIQRNDLFQQLTITGGFGAGSWLIKDNAAELKRIRASMQNSRIVTNQIECFTVFDWMGAIQLDWYQSQFDQACQTYRLMETPLRQLRGQNLQVLRVIMNSFGSLSALHQLYGSKSRKWVSVAKRRIKRLRREDISYAAMIADFHEGMLLSWQQRFGGQEHHRQAAVRCLRQAVKQADLNHLPPFRIAAQDAIDTIESGVSRDDLIEFMKSEGVVAPRKLARLYTPELDSIG